MASTARITACLLVASAVAGGPPAAFGQDPGFWSFLEKGRVLGRCAPLSAAHAGGTAALERLADRIRRLQDRESPRDAVGELHALLKSECFLPAVEAGRVPNPDSSASLKEWWWEGGRSWLASYLELPQTGPVSALQPHIVVPPDTRRTLSLESNGAHPLRGLLCPSADATCGAATRGWVIRADAHLDAHRALGRHEASVWPPRQPPSAEQVSTACAASVSDEAPRLKYGAWRACVERSRPVRMALPLGAFRPPASGWLVIAGRRGHYDFCDTTRAYDLETGAAFFRDSCSGLVLQRDGRVDAQATDRRRSIEIEAGAVSIENMREAAWMLAFRSEAEEVQLGAEYYPLPAGLTPEITVRGRPDDGAFTGGGSWNTGQTQLVWRWIRADGPPLDGEITWPDSSDAAEDHAASLLAIAEKSFARGCPARRPPESLSIRRLNPVNPIDAPGPSIDEALSSALAGWRAIAVCRPATR